MAVFPYINPVQTTAHLEAVEALLNSFARFGVNLGLERIQRLLQALGDPHLQTPVIHVAGTNGKGSVCAFLSSVLTAAGYRVGRYTSPHLVSWTERICVNEQPIDAGELRSHLQHLQTLLDPAYPTPTQFEIITAAAWYHFAQAQVDVAVMEVGLGGRLDATNVCPDPLVTVITSIGWDHWQRLGPTLADIAGEKAGILKPGRFAILGPLPPDAEGVIRSRAQSLNCPIIDPAPALATQPGWAHYIPPEPLAQVGAAELTYPLSLAGPHQYINSALAIAALQTLQQQGWAIPTTAIQQGMARARWPGRLQWLFWIDGNGHTHPLLVDGAHNPEAAYMLRAYLDRHWSKDPQALRPAPPDGADRPITFVMGLLDTKAHQEILSALLRPGDSLHLVSVPGHASAQPAELARLAQNNCPTLVSCQIHEDLFSALADAVAADGLPVLCGSLYLVGQFFKETGM